MLRSQSTPNAASWGVWAFITILNFTSYKAMSKDWVKSLLPTLGSILCILTFVVAGFRGRLGALNIYDMLAIGVGLIASVVWWLTKSPTKAQILLNLCLFIGFIPTFISVWNRPESERIISWLLWTIMFVVQAMVVVLRWKGQKMDLLYPVNGIVLHAVIVVMLLVW